MFYTLISRIYQIKLNSPISQSLIFYPQDVLKDPLLPFSNLLTIVNLWLGLEENAVLIVDLRL